MLLILQKVQAALTNPSIACNRSFVKSWLFLHLKIKSFISLCKNEIFQELRHIRRISIFGTVVPVTREKVVVILRVAGSALDTFG